MAHLFQVGAGSGGMPVLDMLCRDPRITRVTLVEPDVYKPHNVERHLFPPRAVGEPKADLAEQWLKERRPDLEVRTARLRSAATRHCKRTIDAGGGRGRHRRLCRRQRAGQVSLGRPDAPARQAVDARRSAQRRHRRLRPLVRARRPLLRLRGQPFAALGRRWTSRRRRTTPSPGGPVAETTIPASMASIHAIASLHALVTLGLLDDPAGYAPGFTSLLLTLQRVPDVFEEAFRPYRFRVPRAADCLICQRATDAVLGGGTRCGPGSSAGATGR